MTTPNRYRVVEATSIDAFEKKMHELAKQDYELDSGSFSADLYAAGPEREVRYTAIMEHKPPAKTAAKKKAPAKKTTKPKDEPTDNQTQNPSESGS